MYTKLSIPERLKDLRVVDKHLTLEQLAEQTGLSKSALGKYESDDYKDISPFAIATLAKFYGVSTDYLMGVSENKNHPNTELQALHLSDAMVELLSSGKINNRLLCELATHPNFLRLMVDMEIFIDQIADMRVNQMNLILEATRQTILKEHAPGENDLYMRTLELGQVQENDFYSHILHDDLDSIVRDIREAHLKDKTTADPQPTLDEVKENFEQAIQMGTDTEAMIHEFCDKMQIPFEKISSEDFSAFLRILSLSKLLKNQTICGEKPSHSRIICQKRKSAGSKKAIHYKSEWPQFFTFSDENHLRPNDFLCPVAYAVHVTDPCKLVFCFQFLRDSLCFFYLGNDTIQTVLCLLIQIGKICPQLSRQKQFIVPVGTILLQIFPVHPSPPSDWAAFLRQL